MNTTSQSSNIRISQRAKIALRDLSRREGRSMQSVLDDAIGRYERETFWGEANAAFARLRADPNAWREELAERREWEGTLMDGLDKE